MSYAFLFPGQGSQSVGMGRDWCDAHPLARQTFEEADDVLGFSLSSLCFDGPSDQLQLTANTQPAILTTSIAIHRVLSAACSQLNPRGVAGHSLGEYSAHVAAGTLEFADALRLVRRRGELMQEAVPVGIGAMAAILGLDDDKLEEIVRTENNSAAEVVSLANLNSPGQTVIAGHKGAVERAASQAKEAGARMTKILPVSAPFHSPLMSPARLGLEPMLRETTFQDPGVPVVVNIDAASVSQGATARDALERQIDGPVRWVESMRALREDGVDNFFELGPGKVLTGLGKRIDRSASWSPSPTPDAIEQLIEQILASNCI